MHDVKPAQFFPGMPLYRQVQTGIEELIRNNPSSAELALSDAQLSERFGVSRITVRRAVDELVDTGVLYRIQGVGTFVSAEKVPRKTDAQQLSRCVDAEGGKIRCAGCGVRKGRADKDVGERLNVRSGTELVYIQRLRFRRRIW